MHFKKYKLAYLLGSIFLAVTVLAYFEAHFVVMRKPLNRNTLEALASDSPSTSAAKLIVATSPATLKAKTATSSGYFIPRNSGKQINVPILMYHYIGGNPNPGKDLARDSLSVVPDLFEAQMNYLVSHGYNAISLDTMYAGLKGVAPLPPKPIVLTFDDGYIDFYINAYPILRRFNLRATSFLPTALIGTGYYMNWNQVKEIQSSGLVSFQAHTLHHPNLPTLSLEQAKVEILQSKKDLEARLGVPVNFFAYPYGASNETIWNLVKEAGFAGAVGTWPSDVESEGNILDMPRIRIPGGISLEDFAKRI